MSKNKLDNFQRVLNLNEQEQMNMMGISRDTPVEEIVNKVIKNSLKARDKISGYFLCKDKCLACRESTYENSRNLPCMFNYDDADDENDKYFEGIIFKFAFLTCVRDPGLRDWTVNIFRNLTNIIDESQDGTEIRRMVEMSPKLYQFFLKKASPIDLHLVNILSEVAFGAVQVIHFI